VDGKLASATTLSLQFKLSLPDTPALNNREPGADLLLEFKLSINPSSFLGAPHHTTGV
jgi:hypothetical protein